MLDVAGTDEIPHLVIDRPDRGNSVTTDLLEAFTAELEQRATEAVAIVISGAGGRFCSGADLGELADRAAMEAIDGALARATSTIARVRVPVIAAVERYAFGAGVDLAWSCDVVVAARDVRIRIPATRLGILYNPDSLRRLHSRIGTRALRQLLVAGRELSGADHADVVVEPGTAVTAATEVAQASHHLDHAAVSATKRVLDDADHGRLDGAVWEALRAELLDRDGWSEIARGEGR